MDTPDSTAVPGSETTEKRGSARTTREEQAAMVALWRESGRSMAAFAREMGVPAHRLRYWVAEQRRRSGCSAADIDHSAGVGDGPFFAEISVAADAPMGGAPFPYVLRLGGGGASGRAVELLLHASVAPACIGALARELAQ